MIARLRKILFVLFTGTMVAGLILGALAWNAVRRLGPEEVRNRITAAVKSESGLDLVAARVTTQVSYHVVINFEAARLLSGNQQVARFRRITLTCGYRTLLFHGGLPFLDVTMERPEVSLPFRSVLPGPMPVLDADDVRDFRRILVRLSNITRQVVMFRATVEDREGRVLFDEAGVRAIHGQGASAWQLRLKGYFRGVGLPNFRIGASLAMAPEMDGPEVPFARGALWFWDAALQDLATAGFSLTGRMQGNLTFMVRNDGLVTGQAMTRVAPFRLSGPRLAQPISLTNLTVSARVSHSARGLELTSFAMRGENRELLSGRAMIVPLTLGNLALSASLSPLSFGAEQLKSLLARFRHVPPWLSDYAGLLSAGNIAVDQVTFNSTLKDLKAPTARILRQLRFKATLDGLALTPHGFPEIAELDGKLDYAGGLLRLTQSHAAFGRSTLAEIHLSGDLTRGTAQVPYQVRLQGDLDIGELAPLVRKFLSGAAAQRLKTVESVRGKAAAALDVRGHLTDFAAVEPLEYKAVIQPKDVAVATARVPSEIRLTGGQIVISPSAITIEKLDLAPKHGSMRASGRIERTAPGGLEVAVLNLELHNIDTGEWQPGLISLATMDVRAMASGNLSIARGRENARRYAVDGSLTLGPGQIKFDFLRSPVVLTDSGSLTVKDQGARLVIRGSLFEGYPLDLTVSVTDVNAPVIQIDALAQKLDLEAISAVRLPWRPQPPFRINNTHTEGRVRAHEARLARLEMKNLTANFRRDNDGWRVFDINTDTLGGHLAMDLEGRKRDDWVHIKSSAQDLDVAQVQQLAESQTVLTGRLSSEADLWADLNRDFFDTLAGTVSSMVRDGVLLKLKILSRMLSLVNISQWLNAQIPDPRVNGVPFRTVTARFTGAQGVFYCDDFLLDGPVMKMTAAGRVNVAATALNMTIGMRPFQLLDTVFNKIPLIGSRLAESQAGIVAAYFHVQGPIADPSVTPAPIKSISHMLIKTLAIPINILLPETIK